MATAPITVIVPITGDIQNAQICVTAGSSGTQSCAQLIVNPEQTAYTPVRADLTQYETPTVSNAVQQEPSPQTESTQTAGPLTMADSQQAPQSPSSVAPKTTTEPSMIEESPSSLPSKETEGEGQPQGTSEEGEDSNSNPDEDTTNGQ